MSKELSSELQVQIEQEAEDRTARLKDNNDFQAGIIQGNKDGYEAAGEKYSLKWQQAEQRAERYEKALKEIRKWELATGAKIKVKHLDILKEIMQTVNEALTPKQTTDEH